MVPLPLNRQTVTLTHTCEPPKPLPMQLVSWFGGIVETVKKSNRQYIHTRRRLKRIGIQLCAIFAVEAAVIVVVVAGLPCLLGFACMCM